MECCRLSEDNFVKAIQKIDCSSGMVFKYEDYIYGGTDGKMYRIEKGLPIKAKLEGEWYLCGCCGHKLARRIHNGVQVFEPVSCHNNPDNWNPAIEIKCKHKSSGKKCDTINVIEI
jgi:hypothetical protein